MERSEHSLVTKRAGIICAGNWIVDIVHEIENWPHESDLVRIGNQDKDIGGGAANVISALAKLETGIPLWPMGAIGDDDFGQYVLARCQERGLPTQLLTSKPGIATAHTHVMSVTGQTRTFFYQGGANDSLSATDFMPTVFETHPARLFYLGYLTLLAELDRKTSDGASTNAATVLARAIDVGMTTCVDLVSIEREDFTEIVTGSLPYIDYLFLNEVELARACGMQELLPGDTPRDQDLTSMAKILIDGGVRKAVIVHCPQKALWIGSNEEIIADPVTPLPSEDIVSPLGAGDCFCAGVLYGLHEGWAPQQSLELGHAIARASLRGVTATQAIPKLSAIIGQFDR